MAILLDNNRVCGFFYAEDVLPIVYASFSAKATGLSGGFFTYF
jgi:hypothetical protein